MKLRRNILACILISAAAHPASDSGHGFSLALHAPSAPVKAGSEVRLKVTITNTSDHEIRFARSPGIAPEGEFDYEIEVRDAQGQVPPLTPAFRHLKENPTSRWGSYMTYVLEPGKSFEDDLVITRLYTLTAPGDYTIRATRGIRPMWQILDKDKERNSVKSNTITVTVTK